MTAPQSLQGVRDIVERYDVFVFDIWGVIYDGGPAHPGAIEVFNELSKAGKSSILLSNAPRRIEVVEARMADLGLPKELYSFVHTSGQEVYLRLQEQADPDFQGVGKRFIDPGSVRFAGLIEDLGYEAAPSIAEADFILASGPEEKFDPVEAYDPFLKEGLARKLPMICANPDVAVYDRGTKDICAGAIARSYAAMGGQVREIGKPYREVYDRVLSMVDLKDPSRALMIGDNLETDVPGGKSVGMDTLWIHGGIHRESLGIEPGETASPEALESEMTKWNERPHYTQPLLKW